VQDRYSTPGGTVSHRNTVARVLLVLYAIGSAAIGLALLLAFPGTGELSGTTSGKVLAAALFALGFGAVMAVRDPWRDRLVIQILIAFTTMASLAIIVRLLLHDEPYAVDPAWMVLPFGVAAPVLLAVFYPRPPGD
jgi:hypothetical protein